MRPLKQWAARALKQWAARADMVSFFGYRKEPQSTTDGRVLQFSHHNRWALLKRAFETVDAIQQQRSRLFQIP